MWLGERDEGFAPERAEAFAAWCAIDPRHAAAVARVEEAIELLEELPAVRPQLEQRFGVPGANSVPAQLVPFRRFRRTWAGGLAAVLVLGLAGWWLLSERGPDAERFSNEAGTPRRLVLRDGSIVHLNGRSELSVDFSARERRAQLGAGEAYFEVMPDPSRPFVVMAGGIAVRAVGTAFNVRLEAASVEVLVEEGRVEVAPAGTAAPPSAAPVPQVGTGERVRVARNETKLAPTIEKLSPGVLRQALAWHSRVTLLTDVPLADVVARFNRRNVLQLVLVDENLRERKVGGALALDQVEAFVRLLEKDGDVVAERRGDTVLLRRAR